MSRKKIDKDASGESYKHLYSGRWRRERLIHLRAYPLCVHCKDHGMITKATIVDHKIPHRGDTELFWDSSNWQSLCKPCHDSWKQRIEKSGVDYACDSEGNPVNPGNHW